MSAVGGRTQTLSAVRGPSHGGEVRTVVDRDLSLGSVLAGALWALAGLCVTVGMIARLSGADDLAYVALMLMGPLLTGAAMVNVRQAIRRWALPARNAFDLGRDYGATESRRPVSRI